MLTNKKAISKTFAAILIVIVLVCAVSAAYYYSTTLKAAPSSSQPIIIGGLFPLTGTVTVNGEAMKNGADLAISQWNAKGGLLGHPIQFYAADSGDDVNTAMQAVQTLIYQDHIQYLVGTYWSSQALAIDPLLMQNKIITMISGASALSVTQPVLTNYTTYEYLFRNAGNVTSYVMGINDIVNLIGAKTIYWVAEDQLYAHQDEALMQSLYNNSFTIVGSSYYELTATDFTATLLNIEAAKPDAVIGMGGGTGMQLFATQYMQNPTLKKIPFDISGGGVMGMQSTINSIQASNPGLLNGLIGADNGLTVGNVSSTLPFQKAYTAMYGFPPSTKYEGLSYDAVNIICNAIKTAGTANPDTLVPILEKTHYVGAEGTYAFDKAHQSLYGPNYLPITAWQVENGKKVTIWPTAVAQGTYTPPS